MTCVHALARLLSPHRSSRSVPRCWSSRGRPPSSSIGLERLADDLLSLHRRARMCSLCRPARGAGAQRARPASGALPLRTARPPRPSARSRWPASGRSSGRAGPGGGQILVTFGDTEERRRYLYARECLNRLLDLRAVADHQRERHGGDRRISLWRQRRLAARVATMASADLLCCSRMSTVSNTAPPAKIPMRR